MTVPIYLAYIIGITRMTQGGINYRGVLGVFQKGGPGALRYMADSALILSLHSARPLDPQAHIRFWRSITFYKWANIFVAKNSKRKTNCWVRLESWPSHCWRIELLTPWLGGGARLTVPRGRIGRGSATFRRSRPTYTLAPAETETSFSDEPINPESAPASDVNCMDARHFWRWKLESPVCYRYLFWLWIEKCRVNL